MGRLNKRNGRKFVPLISEAEVLDVKSPTIATWLCHICNINYEIEPGIAPPCSHWPGKLNKLGKIPNEEEVRNG